MKKFIYPFISTLISIIFFWSLGNIYIILSSRSDDHVYGFFVDSSLYPIVVTAQMIYGEDEFSLLHEVGHWVDMTNDWVSLTPEFTQAFDDLIAFCKTGMDKWYVFPYENACQWAMNTEEMDMREIYADMYAFWRWGDKYPSFITRFFSTQWLVDWRSD